MNLESSSVQLKTDALPEQKEIKGVRETEDQVES